MISFLQEPKVITNHLHDISAGFLFCNHSPVNGIGNRELQVRGIILQEELPSRPLMEAVDALLKLVGIDFAGAPPPEFSLELRSAESSRS